MNNTDLSRFRHDYYRCFTRSRDALMNLTDALLTEVNAHSFIELSLSPFFERRWPSLYQALDNGRIDRKECRKAWVEYAPSPPSDGPSSSRRWVLGLDASSIRRPFAKTSRDRTAQIVPNLPGPRPITQPGWSISSLVVLPETPSSWTYHLDHQRIASSKTAAEVGVDQLAAVLPLLASRMKEGERALVCGDRYYSGAPFLSGLGRLRADGLPIEGLCRLQGHRVLYRPAPPRPSPSAPLRRAGAPRKEGDPFKCKDPTTHGEPDLFWEGEDDRGHPLRVEGWKNLHFKTCREVSVTLFRVTRSRALDTKRDPRVSWFIYVGDPPSPEEIPILYRRRFGQEHGYRFDKGPLLWTAPHVQSPEQFERWTMVMGAAHNQLVLARPRAGAILRPWESKDRPVTPQQVRRAMGRILGEGGTPARVCQPRGNSPGRAPGFHPEPAPRYPVVTKSTKPRMSGRKSRTKSASATHPSTVKAPSIRPMKVPPRCREPLSAPDGLFQSIQSKIRSLLPPSHFI